jgi:hypothetical protein
MAGSGQVPNTPQVSVARLGADHVRQLLSQAENEGGRVRRVVDAGALDDRWIRNVDLRGTQF